MIAPEPKKRGRKPGSKNSPPGTKPKNITVTNPAIIDMLSDYCDELHNQFGFRPNITQALTHLLTNRKKP